MGTPDCHGHFYKFYFLLLICLCSCVQDQSTLFTPVSSSSSHIDFKNLLRESEEFNVLTFGYFYNGGGVAVGDINNDGLDDIYFTGNMMASHLYLNKGDLKFEEIAASAGVSAEGLWNTGVTMVDINADGWLDIYVCRSAAALGVRRKNQLFINNKNLTFTESAALYGLDDQGYSTQAAFLDYDRDGDLDMYLLNHSIQKYAGFGRHLPQLKNQKNKDYGDRFYQNNLFAAEGQMIGRFIDVTNRVGINSTVLGFGLGLAVEDLNGDGWLDVYVSNDYNEEDYLYINQQDGTFKNEVRTMLDQTSLFSMGNDIADINGDGLADIISLDMLPDNHERIQMTSGSDNYAKKQQLYDAGFHLQSMRNMLHINNGDGSFSEVGQLAGISNTDWSWAGLVEDYDLDGQADLLITNGYKADYTNMDFMSYAADQQIKSRRDNKEVAISDLIAKIPSIDVSNVMYQNKGNLHFENVTREWGLDQISLSNGAAYADLDNDGDLDLLINHINKKASLYKNNAVEQGRAKAVQISLKGTGKNPFGIGARVFCLDEHNNMVAAKSIATTRGFQSSVAPRMVLADSLFATTDKIEVLWPDGLRQLVSSKRLADELIITYDSIAQNSQTASSPQVFQRLNADKILKYNHEQDLYNDFDRQKLMPYKLSDRGPKIISADVNQDGFLDLYVCGSVGVAGSLFIQKADQTFVQSKQESFEHTAAKDEQSAVFFDADGDQDLDLFIACSSYVEHAVEGNTLLINDGRGQFSRSSQHPTVKGSYGTVEAADIDGDGDIDLFVGGFINQSNFPISHESQILINDGTGKFKKKVDGSLTESLSNNIITDASFIDYDRDGDQDLIVVGHWMPITMCENDSGNFNCTEIEHTSGLWNTLELVDSNNDNYVDVLVGNYGLNSQLSRDMPLKLYYDDFDQNGTIDPVLCKTIDGVEYPFAFRDDLVGQLPFLKKQLTSYAAYAQSDIPTLFGASTLAGAAQKNVDLLSSVLLVNDQNSGFSAIDLPWQVQQSPVYAIELIDVNNDGMQDAIVGGNQLGSMVQLGPNLSSKSVLLMGEANGTFKAKGNAAASLGIHGEIRDIIALEDDRLLITRNRDSLIILKVNPTAKIE